MRRVSPPILTAGLVIFSVSAWGQSSACDLATPYGVVDAADVQASINMSLGTSTCTASVLTPGVCNVVVVQRVINASMGGTCLTGTSVAHSVDLNWGPSTTPSVTYRVYRSNTSGGPYTLLGSSGSALTYTDNAVLSGLTYFYVVTAVNAGGESGYSNQAQAIIPTP
jgi:hypothetical protein